MAPSHHLNQCWLIISEVQWQSPEINKQITGGSPALWTRCQAVAHLQTKAVPQDLIWNESAQWLRSSSVRKIPEAFITPMDMPIMPPWANDHGVAHLQTKTVRTNLIWSDSVQRLLSCGIRNIPGAFITHGHAHYAPMGRWPGRCTSTGQGGGCWVLASARLQGPLSCPWACPLCPHGQITIMLHIYRPRRFQRTWFGVNLPSGCWVLASAWFQKSLLQISGAFITPMDTPMWPQWTNDHNIAHLEAEKVPVNLIWCESAQWLPSSGVCKAPGAIITPMDTPIMSHGQMTKTGLNNFSKNQVAHRATCWLIPGCPHQESGCPPFAERYYKQYSIWFHDP